MRRIVQMFALWRKKSLIFHMLEKIHSKFKQDKSNCISKNLKDKTQQISKWTFQMTKYCTTSVLNTFQSFIYQCLKFESKLVVFTINFIFMGNNTKMPKWWLCVREKVECWSFWVEHADNEIRKKFKLFTDTSCFGFRLQQLRENGLLLKWQRMHWPPGKKWQEYFFVLRLSVLE